MENNAYCYVLIVLFGTLSAVFATLAIVKSRTKFIRARSHFYLLGAFLAGVQLTINSYLPLMLTKGKIEPLPALAIISLLQMMTNSVFVFRMLSLKEWESLNDLAETRCGIFFCASSALWIFTFSLFSAPVLLFYFVQAFPNKAVWTLGYVFLVQVLLLVALYLQLRNCVKEDYKIHQELRTVASINVLFSMSSFVFGMSVIMTSDNVAKVVEFVKWVVFTQSVFVFYFSCVLPVVCALRRQKSDTICERSRIISHMLHDSKESLDENLMTDNNCLESFLFFKEVNEFVLLKDEEIFEKANAIYFQFMSERADLDIGLPKCFLRKIEKKIKEEKIDRTIFDEAIDHVWSNNIKHYMKYSSSPELSSPYRKSLREISNFAIWR